MANFIIAKVIDDEEKLVGYRLFDLSSSKYETKTIKEVLELLAKSDADSFMGMGVTIANAEENGNDVIVEGYDKKPVIIKESGIHYEGATHTIGGYNPLLKKFILISYDGVMEKLTLKEMLKKLDVIGERNISNTDIIDQVKKEAEKDAPKLAYIGKGKEISIPSDYKDNDLVKLLYGKTNKKLTEITKAFILHTKMKNSSGILRHYELDDDGKNIGKDDYLEFDVNDIIVQTFVLLETERKKFITIPVCTAFKDLIESFEVSDITTDAFKDFLDFLADENDDLVLEDEKAISEILGGALVNITIDNSENIACEVSNYQPSVEYEKMDATFIIEIKDKKRTKEYVIPSFPWVMY